MTKKDLSWDQHLLFGGISRGCAITMIYPLDTIKTRTQNSYHKTYKLPLYYGYNIALTTQIPYGMIVFGMYENLKNILQKCNLGLSNSNIYVTCALSSDLMGSVFLSPCEIIKQNMQIGKYNSVHTAYKRIMYLYGWKGFYQGYAGLVMRDLPFRMIQLPVYELLKENYTNENDSSHNNMFKTCVVGAIAGMTAGSLTNPIDVVKTRLMCSNFNLGIADVVKHIHTVEGMCGFFYGITYRTLYLGLSSSLFFLIYEGVKKST
jgi:solute carrier family 25 S-adenosylmethionine transporter 26